MKYELMNYCEKYLNIPFAKLISDLQIFSVSSYIMGQIILKYFRVFSYSTLSELEDNI